MAKNLQAGLRQSIKASRKAGVTGAGIFSLAPLDLRFALQKTLDPRVTFTRASNGTYVGSDGLIKTAVTNLLLRSEEFDNASWTKQSSVSVSANTTISPDGALSADTVTADYPLGIFQNITATIGATYTNSVYIKAGTATSVMFRDDTGAGRHIVFNPSTGVITTTSGTLVSSGSQALNDGWYRYFMTYVADSTTVRGVIRPNSAGSAQTFITWGGQIEQSSTVGEYILTTSTINCTPRFDHNPTTGESLGLLVEESRTNIFRNNTMVGAVAGSPGTPPTNGWAIVNSATYTSSILGTGTENGINYIDIQYVVAAAAPAAVLFYCDTPAASASTAYTGSYYLKLVSGTIPQVRFTWQDGISTYNRTLFTLTATLTRYTDTLTTAVSANLARFAVGIDTAPSGATFVIRVGLPQVEQGAFATSVIPTTSATVTRAADVASITGSNFSSWYNQTEGTVFANYAERAFSVTHQVATVSNGTANERISLAINSSNTLDVGVISGGTDTFVGNTPTLTAQEYRIGFGYKADNSGVSANGSAITVDSAVTLPTVSQLDIGARAGTTQVLNSTIKRLTYWPVRLGNDVLQQITR